MAENVMTFANENPTRGARAFGKAGALQSTKSPKRSVAALAVADTTRSPLLNKSKPKQSYLKRGTGLQNRLTAAKHKRYVPKGGFIKGQTEDEGGQVHNARAVDAEYSTNNPAFPSQQNQPHRHGLPRELFEASRSAGSRSKVAQQCMANEASLAPQEHSYAQTSPLHQSDSFGIAQFHANADLETELDADTALVHFPHGGHNDEDRQAHNKDDEQCFHEQHYPDELQQMPERQSTQSSVAGQDHLHNLAGQLAPTGVPDWQVQQAAEVCPSSHLH